MIIRLLEYNIDRLFLLPRTFALNTDIHIRILAHFLIEIIVSMDLYAVLSAVFMCTNSVDVTSLCTQELQILMVVQL